MSVFAIDGDEVTVSRYDAYGLHNLKSAGVQNGKYPDGSVCVANKTVYASPQTVSTACPDFALDAASGIRAESTGIESISVSPLTLPEEDTEEFVQFSAYTAQVTGAAGEIWLTIPAEGYPIISATLYFGGISTYKWIWSGIAAASKIVIPFRLHNVRMI